MVKAQPLSQSAARTRAEGRARRGRPRLGVDDRRDLIAPAVRRKLLREQTLCAQKQADCRTRDPVRRSRFGKDCRNELSWLFEAVASGAGTVPSRDLHSRTQAI